MNAQPNPNASPARPGFRQALRRLPARILRMLRRNWPWKLLSLFLAVCLWAGLIAQDRTLTRERTFTDVGITVNGEDSLRRNSGLIVLSGLEEDTLRARMRVEVPQHEYSTVTAANYNPRVELTRITQPGEQTLKVYTTATSNYGSVESITPDSITVVVDEYVTNYRVPVSVNIIGRYPTGYYGAAPSVNPSSVAVSGPASIVDNIARVFVDFDLSRLQPREGEVRYALPMRFVDADGNNLASDMLEVSSANTVLRTILVEQSIYPTRLVPLSTAALTTGTPAEGYRVKSVSVSPSMLLAAGSHTALETAETLFAEAPVNVTGRSATFTATVRARKPAELAYISTDTITVTVEMEPVPVSQSFADVRVTAVGAADGTRVTLDTAKVAATVTGPQLMMKTLRRTQLTAFVDVSGLPEGTHTLPVQLQLEQTDMEGVTLASTPQAVTVTITRKD